MGVLTGPRCDAQLILPVLSRQLDGRPSRLSHVQAILAGMALPSSPATAEADRVQVELLRRAGVARRFGRARSLTTTTISLARRAIRERRPDASETEILLEFAAVHYGAELASRIREHLARRG